MGISSWQDLQDKRPTVCVTCVWAGVDSAWEQGKLEAWKNACKSRRLPTSGARSVGLRANWSEWNWSQSLLYAGGTEKLRPSPDNIMTQARARRNSQKGKSQAQIANQQKIHLQNRLAGRRTGSRYKPAQTCRGNEKAERQINRPDTNWAKTRKPKKETTNCLTSENKSGRGKRFDWKTSGQAKHDNPKENCATQTKPKKRKRARQETEQDEKMRRRADLQANGRIQISRKPKNRMQAILFCRQDKTETICSATLVKIFWIYERPTVCVSGFWAGWDNAWEQKKPKARKMLLEAADSQKSAARFVGWLCARRADWKPKPPP